MNEVEKMYENAEPDRNCNLYKHFTECPMKHTQCEDCENFVYPTFTAEKQLELIKWLAHKDGYSCDYSGIKPRDNNEEWLSYSVFKAGFAHSFEESLAGLINNLWQDLTEEERKQIRNILE